MTDSSLRYRLLGPALQRALLPDPVLRAGSLYPSASVVGVSDSTVQRQWIERQGVARGLSNVSVVTADVNALEPVRVRSIA